MNPQTRLTVMNLNSGSVAELHKRFQKIFPRDVLIVVNKNQIQVMKESLAWASGKKPVYTPEEQKAVDRLVHQAALEDPGEENEDAYLREYGVDRN